MEKNAVVVQAVRPKTMDTGDIRSAPTFYSNFASVNAVGAEVSFVFGIADEILGLDGDTASPRAVILCSLDMATKMHATLGRMIEAVQSAQQQADELNALAKAQSEARSGSHEMKDPGIAPR